jgi:hypothetical protein
MDREGELFRLRVVNQSDLYKAGIDSETNDENDTDEADEADEEV